MTTKSKTHYYAAISPREFANEVEIHKFGSKAQRDTWVGDRDQSWSCSPKFARLILTDKGDTATMTYHSLHDHSQLAA